MKIVALIVFCAALFSCAPWWNVDADYDPTFPEIQPTGAALPQDIGKWLNMNIRYLSDDIHDEWEYWQSPDQTYAWRCGDCEDYAILMMYMIRQELGGWPELGMGKYYGRGHGWVVYEGRWFEAQGGRDVTNDPGYSLTSTVSYGVTLWRSMNTHKSIE